ncbi:uncharacterized protein LOC142771598 isoform X2 [Rhipicephalus microplus]
MKRDKQKKMPFTNARKKCTCSLDQCVSVAFFTHRKLSSYTGTLHAESETMGHVKCHKDGTIVLVPVDVVYCHGKKIEHSCELLRQSALEEQTDVLVDAVVAEHLFWLATLVWTGECFARPHVTRNEDIFSSVLEYVRNRESANGNSLVSLRRRLYACQRCRSASAYDGVYTGSCCESRVQTTGQHTAVRQVREPCGHLTTAYPSLDNAGIVHSDVASLGLQPCAVVEHAHGSLSEELGFTIMDNMVHPALVDVAKPCIAAASRMFEFQGSISYGSSNSSAGRPAACSNIPGSRRIETSPPHEEYSNGTLGGGGDVESCELKKITIGQLPNGVGLAALRHTPCSALADTAASL